MKMFSLPTVAAAIAFEILIVIGFAASADAARPAHYDALLQLTQESLYDCYEDEANTKKIEFTEAGFEGLLLGLHDVPRNTKCLRYCIMRKNKLFNDENQLSADEMLDFFEKLFNDFEKKLALRDQVLRCKEEATKQIDRCERAHTAAMCILGDPF